MLQPTLNDTAIYFHLNLSSVMTEWVGGLLFVDERPRDVILAAGLKVLQLPLLLPDGLRGRLALRTQGGDLLLERSDLLLLRLVVLHAQRVVLRLPVHYTGILNTSILGAVTLQICSTLLRASLLTHLYARKHHASQSR